MKRAKAIPDCVYTTHTRLKGSLTRRYMTIMYYVISSINRRAIIPRDFCGSLSVNVQDLQSFTMAETKLSCKI